MQELVQASLGIALGGKDRKKLSKRNCAEQIYETNNFIIDQFCLDAAATSLVPSSRGSTLSSGGGPHLETEDVDNALQSRGTLLAKSRDHLNKDKRRAGHRSTAHHKSSHLSLFDMLKVSYRDDGELLGFELRADMFPLAFELDDHQFSKIERVVRACIYLNRLLQDGLSEDFKLIMESDAGMGDSGR